MRVPYIDAQELDARSSAVEHAIIQRIRARRAPRPLQPLDLAMLYSPAVADGWNTFIGAIRIQTSIPEDIKELAISRIAVKNRAWYEWAHHAPLASAAGVSDRGLETLRAIQLPPAANSADSGLTEKQLAVAIFTDAMTVDVAVPDGLFDAIRSHFSAQEIVELTATIAAYNCVSRFLVALDVGERNSTEGS